MSQSITYELRVKDGGDLTGAVLEVTRSSQHYTGTLSFDVVECSEESENTKVYKLQERS